VSVIFDTNEQGSDEWLAIRRGVITGSRFRDALDRKKNGDLSEKCLGYAYDLAREREGGTAPDKYTTPAMRMGTTEEPLARLHYESETGEIVNSAGFAYTIDRKFGVSVDGLIGHDGTWECKTMVSSATLFSAMVDEDISEYRQQCVGGLWLLTRQWCDLTLWAPDLRYMHVIRIERDEDEIERLATGLLEFDRLVERLRLRLRERLGRALVVEEVAEIAEEVEPVAQPAAALLRAAPQALPELFA
jgi:exodeoxyribonuclease (lambda-induced)